MIKNILVFSVVFFVLFFVSFSLHNYVIENQSIQLPFSLKKIYLFHLAFSLLICINFLVLSTVDKFFDQLGFIYLVTIVLKLILFCIIFYKSIFTEDNLSYNTRISLFVPMIIFLLTEAVFIVKILKKKQ